MTSPNPSSLPFELTDPSLERELFALVTRERLARDTGDWELLSHLYWPDSVVRVTWFEGTAAEFIAVSRDQHQRGRGRGMHLIEPVRSLVRGDCGLVESRGQILIRPRIGQVLCDVVNWGRFLSRVERREGVWRLRSFDSIYGKDRIDPVIPGSVISIEPAELEGLRPSYQFLACLNRRAGYCVPDDLPGDDRPDLVHKFLAEATAWVHGDENTVDKVRP
jgi:hypothetical protein